MPAMHLVTLPYDSRGTGSIFQDLASMALHIKLLNY